MKKKIERIFQMSISMKRINEIINSKCKLGEIGVVYDDKYTWLRKENEPLWKGFKRNFPNEYKEEVDRIFDELHPY